MWFSKIVLVNYPQHYQSLEEVGSDSIIFLTSSNPSQLNPQTMSIISAFPRVSEMTFFIFFLEEMETWFLHKYYLILVMVVPV